MENKKLFADFSNGIIDRRIFLKGLLVLTGSLTLSGCLSYFYQESGESSRLDNLQLKNIAAAQRHLFPKTDTAPGAEQINALDYLQFVLHDQQISREDRDFILKGAVWLNETSIEDFQIDFYLLDFNQREKLFQKISQKTWGENWLSAILKYIFEALLSDPLYGGNPNSIGWDWLQFQPGYPRPTELNLYPKILKL